MERERNRAPPYANGCGRAAVIIDDLDALVSDATSTVSTETWFSTRYPF